MYKEFKDPIVIQKYGGTSVGSVERIQGVADRVAKQVDAGIQKIAIVVSAMAGETNKLVGLVAEVNPEARAQIADMAVSAGEQVSVALMSAALEAKGLQAIPLLGFQLGIRTDGFHSNARIKQINSEKIHEAWAKKQIPVIAGFQGITENFEITTLGRGGSDTSAVAVAVAMEADFCEINTDVDGFYTADPRQVKNAKLIEEMDFNVALEMASLGSKVLHTRCVELAAKYDMPLVVRSTFKENESQRTKIMKFKDQQAIEAPVVSGVSVDKSVGRIAIFGVGKNPAVISKVFKDVAAAGINVDIIVHNRLEDESGMRIGFTVAEPDLARAAELIAGMKAEEGFSEVSVETEDNLAKVSVVGLGMQSHHGVASRTFNCLTQEGVDIKMISTSEIKISCVVPKAEIDKAANALHKEFCN